jgi:IS30 family transposase
MLVVTIAITAVACALGGIADAVGRVNSTVTKAVYRHQIADEIASVATAMDVIFARQRAPERHRLGRLAPVGSQMSLDLRRNRVVNPCEGSGSRTGARRVP